MAKVVILGAGLTGLSTAYHLEKNGCFDFKIYEKEATAGGLCRSVTDQGFTFDYTGHLLHSNDPYFTEFLTNVVGLDELEIIKRRSFIRLHDTYTPFPIQVNLHGLPTQVIIDCIEGFMDRPKTKTTPKSFYDWALQKFGKGLTDLFFVPYQQKLFSYDIHQITASWTGRFVPETSLKAILQGSLVAPKDDVIGYNANFYYPKKGGIQFWVNKLAEKITTPIHTGYTVEQVDLVNKIVTFSNGDFEPFETLVSTLPLDRLLGLIKESASTSLTKASKKLLCNSVINFNLGIAKPNLSDKHWIYLPEDKYIPYRLGFYNNFSKQMAPENCSSMYGEIAFLKRLPQPSTQLVASAVTQMQELFDFGASDIITQRVMHIDRAYVIYDFWREKNLPALHTALVNENVHSIGRYGAWKYASMQESLLDGKAMAEQLLNINQDASPAISAQPLAANTTTTEPSPKTTPDSQDITTKNHATFDFQESPANMLSELSYKASSKVETQDGALAHDVTFIDLPTPEQEYQS